MGDHGGHVFVSVVVEVERSECTQLVENMQTRVYNCGGREHIDGCGRRKRADHMVSVTQANNGKAVS
jgi:hypothetical protein